MFNNYFNQELTYKKCLSMNDYNEPVYGEQSTFKARKDGTTRIIQNSMGELVETKFEIMTSKQVFENDEVDGRRVVSVTPMPGLGGSVLYYRVYTQ